MRLATGEWARNVASGDIDIAATVFQSYHESRNKSAPDIAADCREA
jgi:hypothetical protein